MLRACVLGGIKDVESVQSKMTSVSPERSVLMAGQVVQFLKDDEFSGFKRIVFDTAPTGHTIRLLTLPDFIEKIIGKVLTLQQQVKGAADMIKGAFGGKGEAKLDKALQKLENIKVIFGIAVSCLSSTHYLL